MQTKEIEQKDMLLKFVAQENSTISLSADEIQKVVENSQRIEGYEPVSKEFESRVEAFMVKHNVKISA